MTPLLRFLPFRGLPRVLSSLWLPLGLALSSVAVPAQTLSADGWNYKVSGGNATLTRYTGGVADVTVPSVLNGFPVTALDGTFTDLQVVRTVSLPATVVAVGRALWRVPNLTAIRVAPENPALTAVDGVLFDQALTRLIQYPSARPGDYTVPGSVRTLVGGCFSFSSELTALAIPAGVAVIETGNFYSSRKLREFSVAAGNAAYSSLDGVLLDRAQRTLISFPGGRGGEYAVPATVTAIGREAFMDNWSLTGVRLPLGLTTLGISAFRGCRLLERVALPETLTALPAQAFMYCAALRAVRLPDACTAVGDNAFGFCPALTTVILGARTASVADGAFRESPALRSVFFPGDRPSLAAPFDGASDCTVYFRQGSLGWPARIGARPTAAYVPAANWLSNLSIRASLAPGASITVGAVTAYGPQRFLLRAAGPALNAFGLEGLPDPRLVLFASDGRQLAANEDWPAALAPTARSVGAFPFGEGSRDAALVPDLGGAFTVQTSGSGAGAVLIEAYDVHNHGLPRLVNLSTRSQVGTGADILIAGFAVSGSGPKRLLIRAVGPGLSQFGLTGVLLNPRLEVLDAAGRSLAANDDWDVSMEGVFAQAGAFPVGRGSRDAALVISVAANAAYTAQVSGVNQTTGEALVEIYELN
jgi:hypothetical protein